MLSRSAQIYTAGSLVVQKASMFLPSSGMYMLMQQRATRGGRAAARCVAEAEQRARTAEARCDGLAAELRELTLSPRHGVPGLCRPQAPLQHAAGGSGAAPAAAAPPNGKAPEVKHPVSDSSQSQLPAGAAAALVQGLCAALGVDHGADGAPGRAQACSRRATVLARLGRAKPGPGSSDGARAALAGWGLGRVGGSGAGSDSPARRHRDKERAELQRAVAHFQTLFEVPRLAGVLPAMTQARDHAPTMRQSMVAERLHGPCITQVHA